MNDWYVLDDECTLIGPMSELDARQIAFIIDARNGAYNVYQGKPDEHFCRTMTANDWVAANCDPAY